MLERENEVIAKLFVNRTIGQRKSFHLEEALQADIPRGVKAYLQAEVERWLERDLRASQTFSRVDDQATPYVDHLTVTFLRAVSSAYSFTRDQFLVTLDNAISFTENYLCRPRWTLENFLFDEKEVLLLHEFRSKLKYLADYGYFATVLERIVRERGWSEIQAADVRPLIRRIDNEVVQRHGPSELPLLAKPIYEFFLHGKDPSSTPISIEPLLMFFEDKGMGPLSQYIQKICHIRQRTDLSLVELVGIVEDSYPGEPTKPSPAAAAPDRKPSAPLMESPPEAVPQAADAADDNVIPKTSPAGGELHEAAPPPEETVKESATPLGSHDADLIHQLQKRGNIPLTLTYAGLRQPAATVPYPDLLSMVDEKRRQVFIKKLFRNDDAYFNGVLTALNGFASWKEASMYLGEFYDANGLDPYANEVIEFTDIVHQRYTTPGRRVE